MSLKFTIPIETSYFVEGGKPKDDSVAFSDLGQVSEVLLQTFNAIRMINKTLTKCLQDQLLQFLSTVQR